MPTDKPMLTKREVEAIDDGDPQWEQKARNTIEAAMTLLGEDCEQTVDIGGSEHPCGDSLVYVRVFCPPCQRKHALLQAYHGTGTSEQASDKFDNPAQQ